MSFLTDARTDMDTFLAEWGQSLLRRRASASYDTAGMGIEDWSSSLSFLGDPQPLSGREAHAEAGLEHHSELKVEAVWDADVAEHDRVEIDDVTYRVNYVKAHPDHKNIFIYREVAQP